jgi:hypothetical protein
MSKPKKVLRSISAKDAVFTYTSVCCGAPADKPACVVAKGQRIGLYLGAHPEGESTLGTFRCSQCRKSCGVSRSKNKSEEVSNASA